MTEIEKGNGFAIKTFSISRKFGNGSEIYRASRKPYIVGVGLYLRELRDF